MSVVDTMYVYPKKFPVEGLKLSLPLHSSLFPVYAHVYASCRKFGKHIQKRQLEIPEYAASFVDYKALKKV